MRYTITVLIIHLLSGCAGSPPKPPAVQGEYRPINHVEAPVTTSRKALATPSAVSD